MLPEVLWVLLCFILQKLDFPARFSDACFWAFLLSSLALWYSLFSPTCVIIEFCWFFQIFVNLFDFFLLFFVHVLIKSVHGFVDLIWWILLHKTRLSSSLAFSVQLNLFCNYIDKFLSWNTQCCCRYGFIFLLAWSKSPMECINDYW